MIAETSTARMQAIREGLGGIRDILLANSQIVFEENFRKLDWRFRQAQARNVFISVAPRFVVEGAGIVLIVLVALAMSFRPGGIIAAIPVLGALALGAQRLLPLIQQAYQGWSNFAGNSRVMADVLALMETPVVAGPPRSPGAAKAVREGHRSRPRQPLLSRPAGGAAARSTCRSPRAKGSGWSAPRAAARAASSIC